MLSILRKASLPCIKFKFIEIQLQKNVQHHSKPFIFGKNFRITPVRSCQSKPNKEGKQKSFEYTPGTSPVDFMKHGKKKKIPLYQQMTGKTGQLISGMIISVIATGACVFKVGPHTQLKEYTAWWYGQFEKGFKKAVNRKIRELIYEVMEEAVHLTTEEEVKTKYFMANVDDAFCWGGYASESGVLLGIPYNFAYENTDEIDLKKMTFGPRSADPEFDRRNKLSKSQLESEEAKILQNALILSDDAKRFAIARELERAKTMSYRTNGVILPISIVIGYLFSRAVNKKFDLLRQPPIRRLRVYVWLASAMIFFAITLEDINKYYLEASLDTKVCHMGPNYAKGGIEYYDKQLKNGVALRELVADNLAKNAYNIHGDPWPSLMRPYKYILPTSRKEYCTKFIETPESF